MTKNDYLERAAGAYRASFRAMARGGRWNLHQGAHGPVIFDAGPHLDDLPPILVHDIQSMG